MSMLLDFLAWIHEYAMPASLKGLPAWRCIRSSRMEQYAAEVDGAMMRLYSNSHHDTNSSSVGF